MSNISPSYMALKVGLPLNVEYQHVMFFAGDVQFLSCKESLVPHMEQHGAACGLRESVVAVNTSMLFTWDYLRRHRIKIFYNLT